jgi:hypothetical protein
MTPVDFKAWREQLGLSKQVAAKLLGVPREAIDRYECILQINGKWPFRVPKAAERACKCLALQRRIYQELQILESSAMAAREDCGGPSVTKRKQLLRNRLFDLDRLMTCS